MMLWSLSHYYFISYVHKDGSGWKVTKMKGTPAFVANTFKKEIEEKVGNPINVIAFNVVK